VATLLRPGLIPGLIRHRSQPRRSVDTTGRRLSLFWRVFATNAALLIAAALILGVSPITVSWPIAVTEATVLTLGLIVMLIANALLLRLAFSPLRALAVRMRQVDLLDRPESLPVSGPAEVAVLVGAFNEMLRRLEAERRSSAHRSLAAQENERRRVATELHDEVGQTMTGVLLRLEHLREAVAPARREELLEAQDAVRAGLDEIRRIAQELRPELLDHLGLVSALTALARGLTRRTGIVVDCRFHPHLPKLATDAELAVYRIVQESLTNVARHAHANRVEVSVERRPTDVRVTVADNGRGFAHPPADGTGLRGMRERAVLVGGTLTVTAGAAGGIQVVLELPVPAAAP
jgi:two-component system sensor histidine kinase UhpB